MTKSYLLLTINFLGLICVPFFTLTCEKVFYDTIQAARGHDIYTDGMHEGARGDKGGGFPSGAADCFPSFSLIPVQRKKVVESDSSY